MFYLTIAHDGGVNLGYFNVPHNSSVLKHTWLLHPLWCSSFHPGNSSEESWHHLFDPSQELFIPQKLGTFLFSFTATSYPRSGRSEERAVRRRGLGVSRRREKRQTGKADFVVGWTFCVERPLRLVALGTFYARNLSWVLPSALLRRELYSELALFCRMSRRICWSLFRVEVYDKALIILSMTALVPQGLMIEVDLTNPVALSELTREVTPSNKCLC